MAIILPAVSPILRLVENEGKGASLQGEGLVLVVDDQPKVLEVIVRNIERLKYNAKGFSDPVILLDYLRASDDDILCLVTDQSMPSMTGTDLASQLQTIRPDLPVVVISGHETGSIELQKNQWPSVAGVLRKPLDRAELADLLMTIKGQKEDKRQQTR